jgi:hypothetical protein
VREHFRAGLGIASLVGGEPRKIVRPYDVEPDEVNDGIRSSLAGIEARLAPFSAFATFSALATFPTLAALREYENGGSGALEDGHGMIVCGRRQLGCGKRS